MASQDSEWEVGGLGLEGCEGGYMQGRINKARVGRRGGGLGGTRGILMG